MPSSHFFFFFFFNDTATTEIYTLSLHDALPISLGLQVGVLWRAAHEPLPGLECVAACQAAGAAEAFLLRSEEHTSELQSQSNLVCRLLLEKKKKNKKIAYIFIERISI